MTAVRALLPDGQQVTAWTRDAVLERVREAMRTLVAMPLHCRDHPGRIGSSMPAPQRSSRDGAPDLGDDNFAAEMEAHQQRIADERHQDRRAPTARTVSEMEEALAWQWLVTDRKHWQALTASAAGVRTRKVAKWLRCSRESVRLWREKALGEIVAGLNAHG